jgi:hypothetical protein
LTPHKVLQPGKPWSLFHTGCDGVGVFVAKALGPNGYYDAGVSGTFPIIRLYKDTQGCPMEGYADTSEVHRKFVEQLCSEGWDELGNEYPIGSLARGENWYRDTFRRQAK